MKDYILATDEEKSFYQGKKQTSQTLNKGMQYCKNRVSDISSVCKSAFDPFTKEWIWEECCNYHVE